ncbi:hypothetical protein J2J97_32130 (plasmid) [Rhizobium bangladeshense]|uniref:hypothetical protein n=1 Tax=Rhizobium bangladeshense TaxID=1138189 RepID=UPI001A997C34|nr:hypothetical protein [Rhizobium bangladeshense]QSY98555.1 hypothetical protein J2J97_32130 [Rhizobium bangladeshense]
MMANKWIQAVLLGGFGLGLIVGAFSSALSSAPVTIMVVGVVLMLVSLWKTANCRGTDGWGGPYHGPAPRKSEE